MTTEPGAQDHPSRAPAGASPPHLQPRAATWRSSPTPQAPSAHKSAPRASPTKPSLPANPDRFPFCQDITDTHRGYAGLSAEAETARTKKQRSNCFRVWQVITESAKLQ